ncbi:sensor histidine kinase [Crossiella sp. CA-258035]|uniref:sensor histidine kinase n=1 Tax=Crossiella sp. CA-258035 TaxID=2981138 RepID=UPI0024BD1ADD|nr:sensor histidine kinase [Crossiella sp. CA-258035]WHT16558.1 sensor histidine kinase [Crossiella sp. CA-258035]
MASVDSGAQRAYLVGLDLVVGATITVVTAALTMSSGVVVPYTGPEWLAWLIALGVGVPVIVRRRWPLGSLLVLLPFTAAAALLQIGQLAVVSVALVLYLVALVEPRRLSMSLMGLCMVVTVIPALFSSVLWIMLTVLLTIGPWTMGRFAQFRQRDEAVLAEQREQRVVLAERLRIARDLHDIVAHSMSLIAVKAGVANHVADTQPEETKAALAVIEATSRDALADLRRMLGVLRSADGSDVELRPVQGLAELPGLAQLAESAGVTVQLDVAELELPEGVQQAVYRIVQEALTNVVLHSGAGNCQVRLREDGAEVVVEVTDPGGRRSVTGGGGGHGLVGMRERVAAYGGTLSTGRLAGGGFGVCARLPIGGAG